MTGSSGAARVGFAVVALALLLRLAAIWITGPGTVEFGDARDYILHASALCEDGAYPERGNNWFFRAPGFPAFVALVTACHPGSVVAIKAGLAAVDALTTLLVGLLAGLLWRDRRVALVAATWAAVHPVFLLQVADVRSEGLFMSLLTLGLVLFARSLEEGRGRLVLPAGVATGLAALIRPAALLVIPFLAALRLARGRDAPARRWRAAFLLLVGAALPLAPWTARNLLRYGEVLVVNDALGINFWRGTSPGMRAVMSAEGRAAAAKALVRFEAEARATAADVDANADSPGARSGRWLAHAFDNIRADPRGYLSFTAVKALTYWRPWLNPRFHGPARVALSAVVVLPLLALGLVGLLELRAADRWAYRAALAFLLLGWLAHVPFQTVMRFRIPFTDPLLLALASAPLLRGLSALAGRLGARRPR